VVAQVNTHAERMKEQNKNFCKNLWNGFLEWDFLNMQQTKGLGRQMMSATDFAAEVDPDFADYFFLDFIF
jgi:hypothetical protein